MNAKKVLMFHWYARFTALICIACIGIVGFRGCAGSSGGVKYEVMHPFEINPVLVDGRIYSWEVFYYDLPPNDGNIKVELGVGGNPWGTYTLPSAGGNGILAWTGMIPVGDTFPKDHRKETWAYWQITSDNPYRVYCLGNQSFWVGNKRKKFPGHPDPAPAANQASLNAYNWNGGGAPVVFDTIPEGNIAEGKTYREALNEFLNTALGTSKDYAGTKGDPVIDIDILRLKYVDWLPGKDTDIVPP